jgi:sulfotransferase family protein
MFEHLAALESRLDAELPRPGLRGRTSENLLVHAREWSDAVWHEAEARGPFLMRAEAIARGLDLATRPVFICGAHRSGTTLVHDLLDGHPALTVLPSEGSFYTNHRRHLARTHQSAWRQFMACEWCRRLANPINRPPYWLIGRTTPATSPPVAFVRAVATWWGPLAQARSTSVSSWPLVAIALAYASHRREGAIDDGVRRWVEKTPTNERFLADVWREFPDARVVHVVRDPVAVMASRKRMEERARGTFAAIRTALADLGESYRIAEAERVHGDPRKYMLIRFEELLEDSTKTIDRLAAFLDVENLPILHRPTRAGMSAPSNSSFDVAETGAINRRRTRMETEALSPEERLRIAVAVGDRAAALGYAVPA